MKIKLLIFLGLALVGIHGMSAPADVPAMDGWTDALDVAIGKHEEYVAVREPVFFQKIHKNPHFCAQILPYKEERLLCRQKAHTGS